MEVLGYKTQYHLHVLLCIYRFELKGCWGKLGNSSWKKYFLIYIFGEDFLSLYSFQEYFFIAHALVGLIFCIWFHYTYWNIFSTTPFHEISNSPHKKLNSSSLVDINSPTANLEVFFSFKNSPQFTFYLSKTI